MLRAFAVYFSVCIVLVLIILFSAFQHRDNGALSGEIYLRPNAVQVDGE